MTEVAELEVLRRQLEKEFVGKRIKSVEVKTRKFVRAVEPSGKRFQKKHVTPKEFGKQVAPSKVKGVIRRGKYVGFELDNKNLLVFGLGTAGHLVKATGRRPTDKNTHVIVHFTQGPHLRFFDTRRYGECFVVSAEHFAEMTDQAGLDAIDPIPWQVLSEMLSERNEKMKPLLTDQDFIPGLGDLYSDEILFQAGLPWDRPSGTLTPNEVRRLSRAIGEITQDAIKHRGTTLEDGDWRDLYDQPGEHQENLNVYGREGEPCRRCRTPIKRVRVGQRSHYFCPQCQSLARKR